MEINKIKFKTRHYFEISGRKSFAITPSVGFVTLGSSYVCNRRWPQPAFFIYKDGNILNPGGVFGSQTSLD